MVYLTSKILIFLAPQLDSLLSVLQRGSEFCQELLPHGPYQRLDAALICGVPLPAGVEKQLLLDTGLIHLLVVSGSHLAFLESWLSFLPRGLQLMCLTGYCYLVGLQPPVVRALTRRALSQPLQRKLGLTSLQLEAATIFAVLALLHPPWILSRSFLMSWMCGLALCSPRVTRAPPTLELTVKAYLFLTPFCWSSPLSLLWNMLITPLVGGLLFPARLITVLLPPLAPITDPLWSILNYVLAHGPQSTQLYLFISSNWLLLIPIATHAGLLILEVKWRRTAAFSC